MLTFVSEIEKFMSNASKDTKQHGMLKIQLQKLTETQVNQLYFEYNKIHAFPFTSRAVYFGYAYVGKANKLKFSKICLF